MDLNIVGEKLHVRIVAFSLIAVSCFALYLRYPVKVLRLSLPPPQDFSVYLKAWDRVSHSQTPYVAADELPYKYAPGVLPLVRLLPTRPQNAWYVFGSISIFLFGLSLFAGARYSSWREVGYLALGLALAWKGIIENLDYGQLDLLLWALALLAAVFLRRTAFFSGLLIGTLPWLKLPWLLILVPFWLAAWAPAVGVQGLDPRAPRRLRMLVSGYALSCLAWGAIIPSFVFGSDKAIEYSQAWLGLLRTQPPSIYLHDMNQSLWVLIPRWLGMEPALPNVLTTGLTLVIGGIFSGILVAQPPRGRGALAWLAPWVLLLQLMNPLAWRWASLFVVGVPFACDRAGLERARPSAFAFVLWGAVTALWLVQLNPVAQAMGARHWTDFHPFGTIGLYWIVLLLLMLERARARDRAAQ